MTNKIINFEQANSALSQYISKGPVIKKYNLRRMSELMKFIGNPQENLKIIHVAGTSGKTSTSYYLASLLKEAGYSVGLTVSPHANEVNERVQINLQPTPEFEFCESLSQFLEMVDKSKLNPTYFEVLIAFAYWFFDKHDVDYAIVEVGIGGLLDCTNVIKRMDKVCVITDIGLDHTEILGKTIEEITIQKAGIIKTGNSVFMNNQDKKIVSIIKNICKQRNSRLYILDNENKHEKAMESLNKFQKRNFKLALHTIEHTLKKNDEPVFDRKIIKSALDIKIPARMEIIKYKNKTLILDGSHNEQKIHSLVDAIKNQFPDKKISIMTSFGRNKQSGLLNCLELLRELGPNIVVTGFETGQDEFRTSIELVELAEYAKIAGFESVIAEENPELAFDRLIEGSGEVYLVTGSFYLLNPIRAAVNKT